MLSATVEYIEGPFRDLLAQAEAMLHAAVEAAEALPAPRRAAAPPYTEEEINQRLHRDRILTYARAAADRIHALVAQQDQLLADIHYQANLLAAMSPHQVDIFGNPNPYRSKPPPAGAADELPPMSRYPEPGDPGYLPPWRDPRDPAYQPPDGTAGKPTGAKHAAKAPAEKRSRTTASTRKRGRSQADRDESVGGPPRTTAQTAAQQTTTDAAGASNRPPAPDAADQGPPAEATATRSGSAKPRSSDAKQASPKASRSRSSGAKRASTKASKSRSSGAKRAAPKPAAGEPAGSRPAEPALSAEPESDDAEAARTDSDTGPLQPDRLRDSAVVTWGYCYRLAGPR
ncbi:hypothetical protein [Haliangium sp.]|uniref:hypothetical protein n=1 Tax=Haliangium sp. TaxID=2663208 RepID=UPI003D0AC404